MIYGELYSLVERYSFDKYMGRVFHKSKVTKLSVVTEEEKKKTNVEDIINRLRTPAVITERKILKPNRQFQSPSFPNKTHMCKQNACKPPANSLKTSSLLSIVDQGDSSNKDGKILYKNFNFEDVRDTSTQTSKTILQLAKLQTGDMSPDSLSPTPRTCKAEYCQCCIYDPVNTNFDDFSLDGTVSNTTLAYSRKNNIVQYLQSMEGHDNVHSENAMCSADAIVATARICTKSDGSTEKVSVKESVVQKEHHRVVKTDNPISTTPYPTIDEETPIGDDFPKNSLIETFMQKSKSRLRPKLVEAIKSDHRAKFLQQTSPLRKVSNTNANNFRSKSYVEPHHHPNYVVDEDRSQPQYSRFTVTNVHEKNVFQSQVPFFNQTNEDSDSCDRQGGSRIACYQNRRSNSFMMPTLASEQKSKMKEVRSIKRLISPTRRGRSSSPRALQKVSNRVEVFRVEPDRIPYIDQSKSELSRSSPRACIKERKSITQRVRSPNRLSPIIPPMDFQANMLRIDQLSLTLPSDGSYSVRTKGTDNISVSSSENALGAVLNRIQDTDWNVSLKGLAEVTELCRAMDIDFMMPHMIMINQKLIELLRSPRSHVCRTACQAAGHLFESMKDTRGPEFNDIVDILLCKTADANKFIRQDANLALDCMVTHMPTFHAIRAICSKGPPHKNHLVRCASVRLIICAVVIAGPDVILNPANNEYTRRRIFQNMIKFLEDKNLETRKYGERLYKVLSKEPAFDAYLKKYMDKEDLTRMKKSLKFLVRRK